MDSLEHLRSLTEEQQQCLFRSKKTEIAAISNPFLLLNDLKDNNVIPEKKCKEVQSLSGKEQVKGLYTLLSCLEKSPVKILLFWKTLLKDHIRKSSPELQALQLCLEKSEFPGTRRHSTQAPQVPKAAPISELVMLVTCGSREGQLHLSKLMKGEDCILTETRWVSCSGFEVLGGKGKAKKWRSSIRAKNIPLGQLFQELTEQSPKPAHSKRGTSHSHSQRAASPPAKRRATKSPADKGSPQTSSASECEMKPVCQSMKQWSSEESAAEEEGADGKALQTCKILLVKCGCVEGKLYKSRFANAIRGKCIRTPQRWYTPLEFLREGRLQADDQSWGHCIVHGHWTLNRLIRMGVLESHSEDCMCFICIPSSQMNNDDECLPCGQGGELLLCDMCPHSFHNDCHIPPVSKECLSARWICTLCEHSKIPRPLHVTHHMSEVLLCSTKEHLLRCQYLLLRLYCEDKNNTFINNPRHLERYCSVISRPMWLAQMRENLLRNRYQTVGQFVGDVRLIFQNCTKYNKSDKRFLALGKQLKEFFEKEFSSVFGT